MSVDGRAPTFLHCLLEGSGSGTVGGSALDVTGTSSVTVGNCTLLEYSRATGTGQVRVSGAAASVALVNTIVWTGSPGAQGAEIVALSGASIPATSSNIRQVGAAYPGAGNLNADRVAGGDGRISRTRAHCSMSMYPHPFWCAYRF